MLPKRTGIGPECRAVALLVPTDRPHGHDLEIFPLLGAFRMIAERLLDLMAGKGPGKPDGRNFSVRWDIDGLNWHDRMRIRFSSTGGATRSRSYQNPPVTGISSRPAADGCQLRQNA